MGDEVRLVLKDGQVLEYRVCDLEIVPKELAVKRVAEKDGADWLVLMTCYPFSFAGPAPDRFLVWARPAGCPPAKREFRKPLALCAGGRSSFPSPRSGKGLIAGASPVFPPSAREGRLPAPPRRYRSSLDCRKGRYSAEGGGSAFFLFPAVFSTISPRYFGSSTPAISATS